MLLVKQEEIYLDMTKRLKFDNYEIVRDRKDAIIKGIDMLKENDIFSIRKYGKYKFLGEINRTKKGSLVIKYLKYV